MSKPHATVETPAGSVSVARDGGPDPAATLVLAHGAGADMHHRFMQHFATGLAGDSLAVVRFNFVYSERGRKAPDRLPALIAAYRAVAEQVRTQTVEKRLFLGGKSMGGRVASHLVADGFAADGLVFLGYPLHPPGKPDRLRSEHLARIGAPMLFVEGTRDPFCPLETLASVRQTLNAPTALSVVEDGDHSFKVRKSSGRSTDEAWNEAIAAVRSWILGSAA